MDFKFRSKVSAIELEDGSLIPLTDPRSFEIISSAWLKAGWEAKHVYSFSWLGRPIIQLPDDMIRIQEVIYDVKPDVIVETGVAHGGSLIFYASLCTAIGKGRVIGVDIEIRPHNRKAIEDHRLSPLITLVEIDSIHPEAFSAVSAQIGSDETVLVILDSNHSKEHVTQELLTYSKLVSSGSYIIACDGIMKDVCGLTRTQPDWSWNNPVSAVEAFLSKDSGFSLVEPQWPFNESNLANRVSYWPHAFLQRNL
jgi:cephalosporin hydroxylase